MGWSVVFSLIINYALHFYSRAGSPALSTISYPNEKIAGWPLAYMVYGGWPPYQYSSAPNIVDLGINFIFWMMLVLIALNLLNHFKARH